MIQHLHQIQRTDSENKRKTTRDISPRTEIGLGKPWRFATSRIWLSERVAFRHWQKSSWRANGILPLAEIKMSKLRQLFQMIFRISLWQKSPKPQRKQSSRPQRTKKRVGNPKSLRQTSNAQKKRLEALVNFKPATPRFPFRSHLFHTKKNPAEKRNLSRIFFILRRKRCSICRFRLLSRR